jgi:glycosyltransferase involved in cell wall biosynthesis
VKIRVIPAQPHCFAFGGFDIQMHRTNALLSQAGVDVRPLDFWSRDGDFDILHFWGLEESHLLAARFARRYGKKIVLTPLVEYLTPYTRLRFAASWVEGGARRRIRLAKMVDRFLVVNEEQGEAMRQLYGVPAAKLEIIPTILDDGFFKEMPAVDGLPDGFSDFVLCPGNICARKNQIKLAEAAIATRTPVLFAGDAVGGEAAYAEAFERLIAPHAFLRWNRWMDWAALQQAYRAARAVALPSFHEQQPTVGLEAAALGKPLMLGEKPYAHQKFYRGAFLARPGSTSSIGEGLRALAAEPERYTPSRAVVQECRGERVAANLKRIYASLL